MSSSLDNPSSSVSRAAAKRLKLVDHHQYQPLLPGLPDHIAQLCLSLVPPSTLYYVCRSWRRLIYSSSFPPFLSLYILSSTTTTTTSSVGADHNSTLLLSSFDPISSEWIVVPPPSSPRHLCRVCLHHPSFLSRNLPIQSVSVSGNLVLLAATSSDLLPAFPHPVIFNPLSRTWSSGPPLLTPRRWCATGASRASVVVASGIGSHYTKTVARSVEKWACRKTGSFDKKRNDSDGDWEKMRSLSDGKLSREAIDAIGCRGKLYMVNVKGAYAKEGFVYDVNSDEWGEMPDGMLCGWRGPAAAMDEQTIYMVDESRGVLRKYDDVVDTWVDVIENDMLKGAENIAAGGGRVCVLCGGGAGILVVDVGYSPPRMWVLDTPVGSQVLGLHILPRMCRLEFQTPVVARESNIIH